MTTDTLTLAEFILQRTAEDEAVAKSVGCDVWMDCGTNGMQEADFPFIEIQPARVLAQCAAIRAQVDHLIRFMEGDYAPWNEDQLKIMASVYVDHPDWREEWRA